MAPTQSPELNRYLTELERALAGISVGERAEIITEIKSHILDALEKDPSRSIASLLDALGDPKQVANRYLMERGIQPSKPPSRAPTVVKWLVVGFLGTFALTLAFILAVLWRYSPLIEVDESQGRVRLLGGTIDVASDDIKVDVELESVAQTTSIPAGVDGIAVTFANGKFELSTSSDDTMHWECKVHPGTAPTFVENGSELLLDLNRYRGAKCELQLPRQRRLRLEGANGKVELLEPHFHAAVKLNNGKINVVPASDAKYRYSAKITHGASDSFVSDDSPDAFAIDLEVTNGKISRD